MSAEKTMEDAWVDACVQRCFGPSVWAEGDYFVY